MRGIKLKLKEMKSLIKLRDWWNNIKAVPYVAEYQVASQFDHSSIKRSEFKGLLYFQVLVADGHCRLLTFWKDQQSYLAFKDLFPKLLDDKGIQPTWEGIHRVARGPAPWKKYLVYAWIVVSTFFAILGYYEKFAWLFTPPQAEITKLLNAIDSLKGERFETDFAVWNTSSLVSCDARFSNPRFVPLQGSPKDGLQIDPLSAKVFASLKPGHKQSFKVTGRAAKAGDYRLIVEGTAKSSFIFKSIQLCSRQNIKVWKPSAIGLRRVVKSDKHSCCAEIELLVGKSFSPGMEIEATLIRVKGVEFTGVRFPRDPEPFVDNDVTDGAEVALCVWKTAIIEPMKRLSFTLMLKSEKDQTLQDWENVLKKIQFEIVEIH